MQTSEQTGGAQVSLELHVRNLCIGQMAGATCAPATQADATSSWATQFEFIWHHLIMFPAQPKASRSIASALRDNSAHCAPGKQSNLIIGAHCRTPFWPNICRRARDFACYFLASRAKGSGRLSRPLPGPPLGPNLEAQLWGQLFPGPKMVGQENPII